MKRANDKAFLDIHGNSQLWTYLTMSQASSAVIFLKSSRVLYGLLASSELRLLYLKPLHNATKPAKTATEVAARELRIPGNPTNASE